LGNHNILKSTLIGARSVTTLVWAIVLIIVGLIGGGLGGLLVLLGGIIGLVVALPITHNDLRKTSGLQFFPV